MVTRSSERTASTTGAGAVTIWDLQTGGDIANDRAGDRLSSGSYRIRREPGRRVDRPRRRQQRQGLRRCIGGKGVGYDDRRGALHGSDTASTSTRSPSAPMASIWPRRAGTESRRSSTAPVGVIRVLGEGGGVQLLRCRVQLRRPPGGHGRGSSTRDGERVMIWDWARGDVVLTIDADRPVPSGGVRSQRAEGRAVRVGRTRGDMGCGER